jgi:hypothetical protein
LPKGVAPERRAKELIAAAYRQGELIAAATATIERIDFLRARFAVIRGATDPAHRRSHAQLALALPSRQALQQWAIAHPAERLAGGFVFVNQSEWGDFTRLPVWPESELAVVGYAEDGHQLRAAWFDHFRYDSGEVHPPLPMAAPEPIGDVEFRTAWRRDDPQIEADAIAFWQRMGILPADATPERRAKELVLAVYANGVIVAVVTGELGLFPQVRARLAMLRGAVDPALRRSYVGFAMMLKAREILEAWSARNPGERLAGLGGIIEAPELVAREKQPYWPLSGYGVVGFMPDGRQMRVSWFRNFRLD